MTKLNKKNEMTHLFFSKEKSEKRGRREKKIT
jgi:hypothetical protein